MHREQSVHGLPSLQMNLASVAWIPPGAARFHLSLSFIVPPRGALMAVLAVAVRVLRVGCTAILSQFP